MARIEQGTKVHVTTVNGGEADYVVAWTWTGLSYCLCVEAAWTPTGTLWIDAERLRSVEVATGS